MSVFEYKFTSNQIGGAGEIEADDEKEATKLVKELAQNAIAEKLTKLKVEITSKKEEK